MIFCFKIVYDIYLTEVHFSKAFYITLECMCWSVFYILYLDEHKCTNYYKMIMLTECVTNDQCPDGVCHFEFCVGKRNYRQKNIIFMIPC
jgi:hypothetical protein